MFTQNKIQVDIISNTLGKNDEVIKSDRLDYFCQRAFNLENRIYHLDPTTFGIEEFKKAFLGTNKLKEHPQKKPLPYNPEDINIFSNSVFIFKDLQNKDAENNIAYFSALVFFKKNAGNNIDSIHIRFLAGIDENYRGLGFHYASIFKQIFSTLKEFNEKYPDQNPVVN